MIRKNLLLALLILVALFFIGALSSLYFKAELIEFANLVFESFGFLGICVALLFSDFLLSPIPPDLYLLLLSQSSLSENWPPYVLFLGLVSATGGNLGWLLTNKVSEWKPVRMVVDRIRNNHLEFVERYGYWAVVIGAISPVPFSITCWSAGVLKLKWKWVFLATLLRIPRILLAYLLIRFSDEFATFIGG